MFNLYNRKKYEAQHFVNQLYKWRPLVEEHLQHVVQTSFEKKNTDNIIVHEGREKDKYVEKCSFPVLNSSAFLSLLTDFDPLTLAMQCLQGAGTIRHKVH